MTKTPEEKEKPSTQVTGNVGLYKVCMELSDLGLNVMPTARNARGIDIVGYGANGKSFTVSVKTLTKRTSIPFGKTNRQLADFLALVVLEGKWAKTYVWTRSEVKHLRFSESTDRNGNPCFWLSSKVWAGDRKAVGAWPKVIKALGSGVRSRKEGMKQVRPSWWGVF